MKHQPSSILLVTSEFPPLPGGIGNHAHQLAKHLRGLGFLVTVVADQRIPGREDVDFDATLNVKVQRIRLQHFRVLMYMQRCLVVFKMIRQHELVIATGKFPLWLVGFYRLFFKRKFLAVIHGTEVNLKQRHLRWLTDCSLKRFHQVIAVSRYTQSLVAHLGLKAVTVIPNAINSRDWKLNNDKPLELKGFPKLLTVGRLSERKGQLEVIQYLPQLIQVYPEVHYHCVGLDSEVARFGVLSEKLGVTAHVTFHGAKSHAELNAFYRACDVFVMLSRSTESGDVEGFGIAILEANYFGLPAIGTKGSGIEDAIKDGHNGLLIGHNDPAGFVGALQTLLKDKEGYGTRAKAWASEHDWSMMVKRYVEVIEEL